MRVTDAWLALPGLVFVIFLATMVGPSMWNIIIILGLVYWTRYARVQRSAMVRCSRRDATFGAWLGLVPKQISTGDRTIIEQHNGLARIKSGACCNARISTG